MKIRSLAVALVLAGAPLSLVAQQGETPKREQGARREWRGPRGEMRGPRGEHGGPLRGLIEQRERLGLTADQVSRLQAIQQRVEAQNRATIERLQALREQAGLPGRGEGARGGERPERRERRELTAEQRAAIERMREQARPLREQLRQNHQAARREIEAVLTEQQKQQLRELRREHGRRGGEMRGRRGPGGEGRRWREGQERRPGAEPRPQGSGTNRS